MRWLPGSRNRFRWVLRQIMQTSQLLFASSIFFKRAVNMFVRWKVQKEKKKNNGWEISVQFSDDDDDDHVVSFLRNGFMWTNSVACIKCSRRHWNRLASQTILFCSFSFVADDQTGTQTYSMTLIKNWLSKRYVNTPDVDIWSAKLLTKKILTKFPQNQTKQKFTLKTLGGVPEVSKTNEHGIAHRRGFTCHAIQPIPDLRSGINSPPSSAGSQGRPPFQGQ